MAPVAQALPNRFPCWCRAIYSWGGETKRDLGFIEGDLIECLNAGDGSWWMGRLRRDKRMVGLFPSNFVQVLDESFQPASRSQSPMPQPTECASNATDLASKKAKSTFRKPFQAYHAAGSPNPDAAARLQTKNGGTPPNLTPSSSISQHRPYSSMKRLSNESRSSPPVSQAGGRSRLRVTSPMPLSVPTPGLSASSPPLSRNNSYSQAVSPIPSRNHSYSRACSPLPSFQQPSRSPSPSRYLQETNSSPPPPPPPHRVAYTSSRAPSPAPFGELDQDDGSHTPERHPTDRGFTPSPLTTAMNDVMSSLQDMGFSQTGHLDDRPGTPPTIWSPESFDHAHRGSGRSFRPQTSLGIGAQEGEVDYAGKPSEAHDFQHGYDANDRVDAYFQRMESRLRKMQEQESLQAGGSAHGEVDAMAPTPPPKGEIYPDRAPSSLDQDLYVENRRNVLRKSLKNRKSAYELGREVIGRTFTTKSSVTTASSAQSTSTQNTNSTQQTHQSIMSGMSAGGFSATSAGSLARRKWALGGSSRPASAMGARAATSFDDRPETPFTGITYHSSHASQQSAVEYQDCGGSLLGGLTSPKPKKTGFFKKVKESVKTGAANARSTIASGQSSRPVSRQKNLLPNGIQAIAGPTPSSISSAARDMGLGGSVDWVQVRRDVNRSNSLSKNERVERAERCQMMDIAVINSVDILVESAEGDEGLDGLPISEPTDFTNCNLSLVDKSARFVNSLPPMTNPASLAQGFVCRPYRSDVQRLRAIFTWVSERVSWEEDFEGEIDSRRVIQSRRGCAEEVAVLVMEMCNAVGIHAEVVRGYLKSPGEILELDIVARPNHWWNAVIVEGEWRMMDCSLASPTNPKRAMYSSVGGQAADGWWFLARPTEICYTHVPLLPEQQHMVPPMAHEILMALPCACPPYFKNNLRLLDFDTSLSHLEDLEQLHIHLYVPDDVECVAEVEAQAFAKDADGDFFESGDVIRKRALAQADWANGRKRYTIKALLPGDAGQGVLKVYAGKRGLMHSIKSNPHPLAFALPIIHHGQNPPYDFLLRHPTPHAQRHDLYVAQPQCSRLAVNNTFVFSVRQHPSSLHCSSPNLGGNAGGGRFSRAASPVPPARPTSAMSMASASTSAYSHPSNSSSSSSSERKPAKLAIQSPSGKIIRLMRRADYNTGCYEGGDGGAWETVIKISERGTWRGLVLADRTARWCVFAEWESF